MPNGTPKLLGCLQSLGVVLPVPKQHTKALRLLRVDGKVLPGSKQCTKAVWLGGV